MSAEVEKMSQRVGKGPRSCWIRMYFEGSWLIICGIWAVWGVLRGDRGPLVVNIFRTAASTSLVGWVC